MSVYPKTVWEPCGSVRYARDGGEGDAAGRAASFACGCFAAFLLFIDDVSNSVKATAFRSNGCGYMVASGDLLARLISGRELGELHGLAAGAMKAQIDAGLGVFPFERRQCADVCIEALRAAFADLRSKRIEEFRGEKALICTCFGVSEETIEQLIAERSLNTADAVAAVCNAGSGCGSCRMMIEEMIDACSES